MGLPLVSAGFSDWVKDLFGADPQLSGGYPDPCPGNLGCTVEQFGSEMCVDGELRKCGNNALWDMNGDGQLEPANSCLGFAVYGVCDDNGGYPDSCPGELGCTVEQFGSEICVNGEVMRCGNNALWDMDGNGAPLEPADGCLGFAVQFDKVCSGIPDSCPGQYGCTAEEFGQTTCNNGVERRCQNNALWDIDGNGAPLEPANGCLGFGVIGECSGDSAPNDDDVNCISGCKLDNTCFPIGYRTDSTFCALGSSFVTQYESDASCNNDFECDSNVCAGGMCVDQGLFSAIIEWFANLFG